MAVLKRWDKFTLNLNMIKEDNKEKLSNFRQYLELNNIKNIDRREDFLLRCFMDINKQYDVLFKKNSNNNDYLRILYKIHRFLMDAFISVAVNLKCLDYVDFCFNGETRQILTNFTPLASTSFTLPETRLEDNIIENYEKENIILLNNYNSFFETINFDNKFNSFYGHSNLAKTITYNIDSYVFKEIFNYCKGKNKFKILNNEMTFNPVLEREQYLKLERLISDCDMTILSKYKNKVSNFILTSPQIFSILSQSYNFKPNNSNLELGSYASNVGEYKDKNVCVLNDMDDKILIMGSHYSTTEYFNSDILLQVSHIIKLPDLNDLDNTPVFMESTVKVINDNLQVIKIEDNRKELKLNYEG